MLKLVLTLFIFLYHLNFIVCRFPPEPYHIYTTRNLTDCEDPSECKPWQRCHMHKCFAVFSQKCFKHWHCRGFARCVNRVCQEAPIPKETYMRPTPDSEYCNCEPEHVCINLKCYKFCKYSGECPFTQVCGFSGFCY